MEIGAVDVVEMAMCEVHVHMAELSFIGVVCRMIRVMQSSLFSLVSYLDCLHLLEIVSNLIILAMGPVRANRTLHFGLPQH